MIAMIEEPTKHYQVGEDGEQVIPELPQPDQHDPDQQHMDSQQLDSHQPNTPQLDHQQSQQDASGGKHLQKHKTAGEKDTSKL